jgi:hypothetical protein
MLANPRVLRLLGQRFPRHLYRLSANGSASGTRCGLLHRLDPPQDQFGVWLADGEGEHAFNIGGPIARDEIGSPDSMQIGYAAR